jgi:hypothetical protein
MDRHKIWPVALGLIIGVSLYQTHEQPKNRPGLKDPTPIRTKLRAIKLGDAIDVSDYLERLRQIKPLIPEMHEFYRDSHSWLKQFKEKHANDADLLAKADFIEKLNDYDERGFALLEREVELGDVLAKLPRADQQSAFDKQIVPLQKAEDALAKEEIKIASDAQKKGITLPGDVADIAAPVAATDKH